MIEAGLLLHDAVGDEHPPSRAASQDDVPPLGPGALEAVLGAELVEGEVERGVHFVKREVDGAGDATHGIQLGPVADVDEEEGGVRGSVVQEVTKGLE